MSEIKNEEDHTVTLAVAITVGAPVLFTVLITVTFAVVGQVIK